MPKKQIAVVYGGTSAEREISLLSGAAMMQHLDRNCYDVIDIDLQSTDDYLTLPEKLSTVDCVLLGLHGKYGEDGHIQSILDLAGIPYTGSGTTASAIAMDKWLTGIVATNAGLTIPRSELLQRGDYPETSFPCIVKPNSSGSSNATSKVDKKKDLEAALNAAFAEDSQILVQECIVGREFTCGILGDDILPIVEIKASSSFFDYEAKYTDTATQEICPAKINAMLAMEISTQAKTMHQALGCTGLTRSDFMVDQAGTVYFLEINTIPGFTEHSLCPKAALAAGYTLQELLSKQIDLAMTK